MQDGGFYNNGGNWGQGQFGPDQANYGQAQPQYQQGGYQQSGYQQGGYQQGGYQQSGYQQSGYQQSGYQSQPQYGIAGSADLTSASVITLTQREAVLKNPDVVVGSECPLQRNLWVYDYNALRMKQMNIWLPPAMEATYREIIANATDNANRTLRAGLDPGEIIIEMNEKSITVTNFGNCIGLEEENTPEGRMYLPQKIFGTMLTSSNFVGERHDAGKNGIGAKATNIFSSHFTVVVQNARYQAQYTQHWSNNMSSCSPPVIIPMNLARSSVSVTFIIDFDYFKYTPQYTEEFYMLYMRHAMDASFNTEIPVTFNGTRFYFARDTIKPFGRVYFGDAVDTAFTHFEYTTGQEVEAPTAPTPKRGRGRAAIAAAEAVAELAASLPGQQCRIKLLVCDTPGEQACVSYVNCIMTNNGGTHVDAAVAAFGTSIVDKVNAAFLDRHTTKTKGKNKGKPAKATPAKVVSAAEKRSHTIHLSDLLRHVSILISVRVIGPRFDSQSKTQLTHPPVLITISDEAKKMCDKWALILRLKRDLQSKQMKAMGNGEGGRGYRGKGVDANWAGKENKQYCILCVTEGETGQGYSSTAIASRNMRDRAGQLPLRGKIPTSSKADLFKIEKNTELAALAGMLGLRFGENYFDPEIFATLRYGAGLLVMTDADPDGYHILGLIIDYFQIHFPTLLQRGYIMSWSSPIVSVRQGKGPLTYFYSIAEFRAWQAATPDHDSKKWIYSYYKGLGTSSPEEVALQMKMPRVIHCLYDDQTPAAVALAFDPNLRDSRKAWLMNCSPDIDADHVVYQTLEQVHLDLTLNDVQRLWMYNASQIFGHTLIMSECFSDYFNYKFIHYSLLTITRAIPADDGLKTSQRKIIFAMLFRWPHGSRGDPLKVAQLGGVVAEKTHYPHGEKNLEETIVKMARNFTGTNNANLLRPMGMFGNNMDGADGASPARYIKTKPTGFFYHIFNKNDLPLVTEQREQSDIVEPLRYYTIVPLAMLNGWRGVATGYAGRGPAFNPLDVCAWIMQRLIGIQPQAIPHIMPWYRFFRGTIMLVDRRVRKDNKVKMTRMFRGQIQTQMMDDTTDDADEDNTPSYVYSMISYGNYYLQGNVIMVDALPLGMSGVEYKDILNGMIAEKKITSYEIQSTTEGKARDLNTFAIKGFHEEISFVALGLERHMSMANMILLNDNNIPVIYDNPEDLLESFVITRMPIYHKRKEYLLAEMHKLMVSLSNKARFIQAVVDGEIIVYRRPRREVEARMCEHLGFTEEVAHALFGRVLVHHLTQDDIDELNREIAETQNKYNILSNTSCEAMWYEDLQGLVNYIMNKPRRRTDFNNNRQGHNQTFINLHRHHSFSPSGQSLDSTGIPNVWSTDRFIPPNSCFGINEWGKNTNGDVVGPSAAMKGWASQEEMPWSSSSNTQSSWGSNTVSPEVAAWQQSRQPVVIEPAPQADSWANMPNMAYYNNALQQVLNPPTTLQDQTSSWDSGPASSAWGSGAVGTAWGAGGTQQSVTDSTQQSSAWGAGGTQQSVTDSTQQSSAWGAGIVEAAAAGWGSGVGVSTGQSTWGSGNN